MFVQVLVSSNRWREILSYCFPPTRIPSLPFFHIYKKYLTNLLDSYLPLENRGVVTAPLQKPQRA